MTFAYKLNLVQHKACYICITISKSNKEKVKFISQAAKRSYEAAVKRKTIRRLSNYINVASVILFSKKILDFLRGCSVESHGVKLLIFAGFYIWHVVPFFREREVFPKDGFN